LAENTETGKFPCFRNRQSTTGSASFMIADPDRNTILFDQHVHAMMQLPFRGSTPPKIIVINECSRDALARRV
jgi:hypothetical protein